MYQGLFNVTRIILLMTLVSACVIGCAPRIGLKSQVAQQGYGQTNTPVSRAPRQGNPYPVIPQKYFTGNWYGATKCGNGEGPTSITLSTKDSTHVYVHGLLNDKDSVEGKVRGYVVILQPQNGVEGNLSLSNDHLTLRAFFTKQKNEHMDTCTASYHTIRTLPR
jgi:hypothetical protein